MQTRRKYGTAWTVASGRRHRLLRNKYTTGLLTQTWGLRKGVPENKKTNHNVFQLFELMEGKLLMALSPGRQWVH